MRRNLPHRRRGQIGGRLEIGETMLGELCSRETFLLEHENRRRVVAPPLTQMKAFIRPSFRETREIGNECRRDCLARQCEKLETTSCGNARRHWELLVIFRTRAAGPLTKSPDKKLPPCRWCRRADIGSRGEGDWLRLQGDGRRAREGRRMRRSSHLEPGSADPGRKGLEKAHCCSGRRLQRQRFAPSLDGRGGRWFPSEHRPAIDISTLNAKRSLLLTRPAFIHHATDLRNTVRAFSDVFDAVSKGISKPSVWKTFALADVTDTHVALDDSGCDCLKPQMSADRRRLAHRLHRRRNALPYRHQVSLVSRVDLDKDGRTDGERGSVSKYIAHHGRASRDNNR